MRQLGVSIIGTDTDVGKTFVTGLLGALAVDDGFDVGMVKPVSSSAVPFSQCGTMDEDEICMGLESKDATYLMQSVGIPESRRREVNPIALAGGLFTAFGGRVGRCGHRLSRDCKSCEKGRKSTRYYICRRGWWNYNASY